VEYAVFLSFDFHVEKGLRWKKIRLQRLILYFQPFGDVFGAGIYYIFVKLNFEVNDDSYFDTHRFIINTKPIRLA
jgi:hypothetical protein